AIKTWKEMRLAADDPDFANVKIEADGSQSCLPALTRFRTLRGACNDVRNPAMGSTGQLFARNVEVGSTFPVLGRNEHAKNRHGGRVSLMQPDPEVISRKLFTRDQKDTPNCNQGHGTPNSNEGNCSYKKAPFFNVLAAFWIQFMTHDWFSHLDEARNDPTRTVPLGCASERVDNVLRPISPERAAQLGCRQNDRMDAALIAQSTDPATFIYKTADKSEKRLARAYKTTEN